VPAVIELANEVINKKNITIKKERDILIKTLLKRIEHNQNHYIRS